MQAIPIGHISDNLQRCPKCLGSENSSKWLKGMWMKQINLDLCKNFTSITMGISPSVYQTLRHENDWTQFQRLQPALVIFAARRSSSFYSGIRHRIRYGRAGGLTGGSASGVSLITRKRAIECASLRVYNMSAHFSSHREHCLYSSSRSGLFSDCDSPELKSLHGFLSELGPLLRTKWGTSCAPICSHILGEGVVWGNVSGRVRDGSKNSLVVNCYIRSPLSTGIGMIRVRCGVWPGGTKICIRFACYLFVR